MNQIEDMNTFVRIVDAGSITKAAEQMNTVKSAVSRRLTELEKRLGVSLLTRTTRAQVLTESGSQYYLHCQKIIEEVAEIESSVRNVHGALIGRIKLAAPLSFGIAQLGPALRKFNELHPDIIFDIDFNDRKVDIVEEGFDLAIRISNLKDSSLVARKITSTQLILCASPGYLAKYGTPKVPKDLINNHVKLNYQSSLENWVFTLANGKKQSISIPAVITANNGTFLSQAAIDGRGLTFAPDFIVYKAIKLGQLIPVLSPFNRDNEIPAYAIYPKTKHLPKRIRSLIDFLVQYFGSEPYWQTSLNSSLT